MESMDESMESMVGNLEANSHQRRERLQVLRQSIAKKATGEQDSDQQKVQLPKYVVDNSLELQIIT